MGHQVLIPLSTLEEIIKFFEPRAREFEERIRAMGTLPPALHVLTKPTDAEFATFGGLVPAPPIAPAPGRITPAPVPIPTPPQLSGPSVNPSNRPRRGAITDGSGNSMASPAPFQMSPAAVIPTSASPAASSPPKTNKNTKPRAAQKRKLSKPANTPTPVAEPASTPTPATTAPTPAAVGQKRSFDDTEGQALQQGPQPSAKRVKTESSPPAMPPKPATPPPQISAPINREDIRTAEDVNELLVDSLKKEEEQAAISQSQGQGMQEPDLETWLSQLVANSADAGLSFFTDLSSLVAPPNETESQVEGADIDFFDYIDFEGSTVPELDQRPTLSPESHNDATTTPPSQANVPPRPGTKPVEQKATGSGPPPRMAGKVEDIQVEAISESDLLTSFFENAGSFSYDGRVEPLDEPWTTV